MGGTTFDNLANLTDSIFDLPYMTAHTLIGGCTGSGKSVLINGVINRAFEALNPSAIQFVLIDPKRVELVKYKDTSFCTLYASGNDEIIKSLRACIVLMEERYKEMQAQSMSEWNGSAYLIVIDELADLMTQKDVRAVIFPMLQRIAQLGRAAHIHLICATQAPSRKVIPAELTLNFTMRIALRCATSIESKQVLNGFDGAELLPKYGECLINLDGRLSTAKIEMTPPERISGNINNNYQKNIFNLKERKNIDGIKTLHAISLFAIWGVQAVVYGWLIFKLLKFL